MKLKLTQRSASKKSEANRLRREKKIPAIIYKRGKEGEAVAVDTSDFMTLLRTIKQGHLPTTVCLLVDENGKERRAVVKEIQYNPINYDVIHLDFEELVPGQKIKVKVPIEFVGAVDCIGVKLGGAVRAVKRHLRIQCLPEDLPQAFPLDVRSLGLRESRRLKELEIPNTVRPLEDLNEVAVVIAKR